MKKINKLLTKELREDCKKFIAGLMQHPGVKVCMGQGSVAFENYIQVELAGWLAKEFYQKMVVIESDPKSNVAADIIIKENKDSTDVLAAIELKIVRLGTATGDGIRLSKIFEDIQKLKGVNQDNVDKSLICCVYLYGDPQKVETSWGELNSGGKNENKRKAVLDKTGDQEAELLLVNKVMACVDFLMVSS